MTNKTEPFDDPRCRQSDELSTLGELEIKRGVSIVNHGYSMLLQAAHLEYELAMTLDGYFPRIRSTFAISAVSLCIRARDYALGYKFATEFEKISDKLCDQGRLELDRLRELCVETQDESITKISI